MAGSVRGKGGTNSKKSECGVCRKNVSNRDNGLLCDGNCETWFHAGCVDISDEKYQKIQTLGEIVLWMCNSCRPKLGKLFSMEVINNNLYNTLDRDIKKIEELYDKLIVEKDKRIEELQHFINAYAAHDSMKNKEENLEMLPQKVNRQKYNIVLKNKKGANENIRQVLEKEIDPSQLAVGVLKVRDTRAGDVVISCEKPSDITKLKNAIEGSIGDRILTEETKNFRPRMKINGVKNIGNCSKEELEQAIIVQNEIPQHEGFYLKVVLKVFIQKFNDYNIIIEVDTKTFEFFNRQNGRIKIKWNTVLAREYVYVKRCFNCWGFGHEGKSCSLEKVCMNCNGKNHQKEDCRHDRLECPNCVIAKEKYNLNIDANHSVKDYKCPCYVRIYNRLKSRVCKSDENL